MNELIRQRLHPAQRRYLAEDLVRLRRSDEQRRYSAPQRGARIDANPHQIDAVIFALGRLREGGCILADEVGLGKTIEAGLVMAQLKAEGARRVLLIAPKPLLGQWRQELFQLFNLDAVEAEARVGGFDGEGIFLIGREAAGSVRGSEALLLSEAFDLCVIDEAHEVFAGIHKRFNRLGEYLEESPHAQTAGRLRAVLKASGTPVLLLTATPMQNSLLELWGLVQYVDPLGTLLGDLPTFRDVFCGVDERQLALGQEEELRDRLQVVLKRTLRREAQEFLEKPFVGREARLFRYTMTAEEKALYDDVTGYLLQPGIRAFQGRHRQLLLLNFHRLMASSTEALAASLERVATRLRRMIGSDDVALSGEEEAREIRADLEEDATDGTDDVAIGDEEPAFRDVDALRAELQRVDGYVSRARSLGAGDSKFRALLQALRFVSERGRPQGARKLVIFTESRVTQIHLRQLLIASGQIADDEITLFSGTNDSARALQALARWQAEVPQEGAKPKRDVAIRLALVHEFKTRTRVFISTEAGAKGLNLQFCDTLVNYDLPWNPQRIEQRIGRCHRYGQKHDVTVINFLATDNLAQALTFEILSQKLELFGTVLDASDQVLHRSSESVRGEVLVSVLGADFESELRRIYDRARTQDEVTEELRALRDHVAEERARFESAHLRTTGLIETRLEEGLQGIFRGHKESVPRALAELDRHLSSVVLAWLDASAIPYERSDVAGEEILRVGSSALLPEELKEGMTAAIGPSKEHLSLYLDHPLVLAAVAEARALPARMSARIELPHDGPEELRRFAGKRGRMRLVRLSFDGFERVDLLAPILFFEDGEMLSLSLAEMLLRCPMHDVAMPANGTAGVAVSDDVLQDATDETLFAIQASVDGEEQKRFDRAAQQADRYVEDRLLVLRNRRRSLTEKLDVSRLRRDGVTGSVARSEAEQQLIELETDITEVDGAIDRLERRDDPTFRRYQEHIHRRRYTPPRVQPLFDLDLEVV
jgi:superfamily II DNA or RNA helicase